MTYSITIETPTESEAGNSINYTFILDSGEVISDTASFPASTSLDDMKSSVLSLFEQKNSAVVKASTKLGWDGTQWFPV